MLVGTPLDLKRRKQALRQRLALDFQPLQDTLAKGLELLVDVRKAPEAAVYCTATVEAFCDALFTATIKELSESAGARVGPIDSKITVFHLQVALRSHSELAGMLKRVESAAMALEFFLDDATSRALYERKLITNREAKHLLSSGSSSPLPCEREETTGEDAQTAEEEQELIRRHARTRSEWQKREDDPFTDVDFAMVLKCVHPAFTLSYNATMLLSALVRELLNEVCARADLDALQRRRQPPELLLEDLQRPLAEVFCGVATGDMATLEMATSEMGPLATQIANTASEGLARFRLQSRRGKTLTLRFRVHQAGSNAALQPLHVLSGVSRDAPFSQLLVQMRKLSHLPTDGGPRGGAFSGAGDLVAIYRAHQVEPTDTPAALAIPSGAVVHLVARRWWDFTRRNEARRGLLSSQRPQDALVRSLVAGTESKVKKELRAAATGEYSPQLKQQKRRLRSSASTGSTASSSSLLATSSSSASVAPSASSRVSKAQEEDSLSALLKERATARRGQEGRRQDNNVSAGAPAEKARRQGLSMAQLAATSRQLLETLDGAWLEFTTLTTDVRGAAERLARRALDAEVAEESPKPSAQQRQTLEDEWRARVRATEELAAQTRAAHELAARMLSHVRLPLAGTDGDG
ncbi:hypothetical protein BBJ28_00025345 [Nothophytophthora sp. Chile5]|nr:hypothetical protein BBJ28_00025345 [Nothophytophthora sp. Chile5]